MKSEGRFLMLCLAGLLTLAAPGCAKRTVQRVDAGSTIDLSGRWNSRFLHIAILTSIDTGFNISTSIDIGGFPCRESNWP
jgi:hypothetical protein